METYIAFLRGINVGGRNLISMKELAAMAADLGFHNPKTFLQSGNLRFQTNATSTAELEAHLREATQSKFGLTIDYFVRSSAELASIIAANPFPHEAESDPSHLLVMFLHEPIREEELDVIRQSNQGLEQLVGIGRELYITYPDGIGTSKLRLKLNGTARNLNTLNKLS